MANFWLNLPKPFTVMAPMDDVTDNVFRQIVMMAGRPDVFFTEFANIDGLVHGANGIPLRKLNFTLNQHPIVAQIWGTDPTNMEKAAKMVKELGFDGIDINMGCPVKDVVKKGAGAGLIGKLDMAGKLVEAAKNGASGLPVSVKTRLGIKENIATEWMTFLLKQELAAITIHARLAKQMSKGLADWEEIKKIVKIKDSVSPETVIIGNGDVKSYEEAVEKQKMFGVDGVMIGRGVFANPWVFRKDTNETEHSKEEYLELLAAHIKLFEKTWGETKNFAVLKKFVKMYVNNFKGASELRKELMDTKDLEGMRMILGNQVPVIE